MKVYIVIETASGDFDRRSGVDSAWLERNSATGRCNLVNKSARHDGLRYVVEETTIEDWEVQP